MTRFRFAGWSLGALACGLVVGCGDGSLRDGGGADPLPAVRDVVGKGITRPSEPPPVEVTPRAVAAVRKVLAEMGEPAGYHLRLSATPGGCTGFINKLDLDPEVTAEDHVFESSGVRIAVAGRQLELFRGSLIDHVEEKGQVGFKITNPKREAEAANEPCPVPEKGEDGNR